MPKFTISDEDRALFKAAVENVTPLSKKHKTITQPKTPPKPSPKIKPHTPSEKDPHPLMHKQPASYVASVDSEETLNFFRPGLQTRVIQRLKRGAFLIDAVLDLHGFNSQEAEEILENFLNHALQQHWRCVHIIHGKGARHSQAPVLKNHINQWLRTYPAVLAFCSAQVKDGGAGAVYVLLKSQE